MKYLLNDQGIDWFKKELEEKYFPHEIKQLKKEPTQK